MAGAVGQVYWAYGPTQEARRKGMTGSPTQARTIEHRVGAAHRFTRQQTSHRLLAQHLWPKASHKGISPTMLLPRTRSLHCHELARKQTGDWKRWTQQSGGGRDNEVQGTRAETATPELETKIFKRREGAQRSWSPAKTSVVG